MKYEESGISDFFSQASFLADQVVQDPTQFGLAVGTGMALVTGGITHWVQSKAAEILPVLYSEHRSLAERNDATRFYGSVNDLVMKLNEHWNERKKDTRSHFIGHSEAREVDRASTTLELVLREHDQLRSDAARTINALDSAWSYSSSDNYRTEVYFVSVPKADGKGSRMEMRTRQVYESTDHYFSFDKERWQAAKNEVVELLRTYEGDEMYDPGMAELQITPDSRIKEAIRKTINENNKPVSDEQASELANEWIQTAVITKAIPEANSAIETLRRDATDKLFAIVGDSGSNYHFNTSSRSHSGPEGYRACNLLEGSARTIYHNIDAVFDNINSVKSYVQGIRDVDPRDKKLFEETIDLAFKAYKSSFPESSLDVDQRISHGLTVGVAAGSGILSGIGTYLMSGNF